MKFCQRVRTRRVRDPAKLILPPTPSTKAPTPIRRGVEAECARVSRTLSDQQQTFQDVRAS